MTFDQITLSNGLRLIGESMPNVRSVSVGLWIGCGSRYETEKEAGLSHFIEHMVFKGSSKRTAKQIAEEMDAVGGQINAYTAKEYTCFYAKVVDAHLPLAMDVIADMVTAPTFDADELEKEKGVVIEEIAMSEDTPEDLVFELLMRAHYGDQPLARPILGVEEGIRGCTREDLIRYWSAMYKPQNAVLSIAGNYRWDDVVKLAEALLGHWSGDGYVPRALALQVQTPARLTREKDIEQIHICLGYPALHYMDERALALSVANGAFGGAMSSRLFQRIREESGMAYSVFSAPDAHRDTGILTVYAATSPQTAETVVKMLNEEARRMAEGGMTEAEFAKAREQLKAEYILGLESSSARMQSIGRRLLLKNNTRTEEETLALIDEVQRETANTLIAQILTAPHSMALVGNGVERIMN